MSRTLDEKGRREFPFPRVDSLVDSLGTAPSSSGSSDGLQSRSDSTQSKSLRSSNSSGSPSILPRSSRLGRDSDSVLPGVQSKYLSRLMPRDHHDTRSIRTILAVTTERLESETRRADDAERRVLEVLRKLRGAHEATMLAQAEASRAKEELTLYKYRFDDAQREILRAQELLNDLEMQKVEAEAEAARARSTARKYREQQVIARAREEGRQAGFQEGFSRGKDLGYQEATGTDEPREREYGLAAVDEMPEEEEEEESRYPRYRAGTPGPAEIHVRTPGLEYRNRSPGPSAMQSGRVSPPTPPQGRRPPSRFSLSRSNPRPQFDTAHHAATLPVPTLVTPINAPSPSHSRADTPTGIPVPHPAPRSLDDGTIQAPIPIHEPAPSPVHPPVEIPPDGYIPYAGENEEIYLPPPHELSRPVTPASPSIVLTQSVPSQSVPSQPSTSTAPHGSEVRSRDYAYDGGIPPMGIPVMRSNASRPMSPQSKASTSISQFDLVGAPRRRIRVSTSGRLPREDRQVMSPRGPRPREDLAPPARPPTRNRQEGMVSERSEHAESPKSPLEKLFKKRFRSKSSRDKDSPPIITPPIITPPIIPDIHVESPSTPSGSQHSSAKTTITHPHLLSPEQYTVPPPSVPSDEIIVMRTEIPGYHPVDPSEPYAMSEGDAETYLPAAAGPLPPGFIPLTPPMQTSNPIPVPSNTPIPIPSPNNPLPVPSPSNPVYIPAPKNPLPIPSPSNPLPVPVPSNTPVPVIPPPSNPTPVPYRETPPIRYDNPLPLPPQTDAVPVPQRGRRYDEAPIPAGVVYPDPPSRRSQTPSHSTIGSPTSSRRRRLDVRSPGDRLSPLPMSFQFFAPLKSETTASEVRSP